MALQTGNPDSHAHILVWLPCADSVWSSSHAHILASLIYTPFVMLVHSIRYSGVGSKIFVSSNNIFQCVVVVIISAKAFFFGGGGGVKYTFTFSKGGTRGGVHVYHVAVELVIL